MCLPENTGGEACLCQDSREGGVQTSFALASTVLFGYPCIRTARGGYLWARVLKAFSLLRFFVAKDQEMTCRHAQWLIVIKKIANLSRPLALKAAPRHRPRPLPLKNCHSGIPRRPPTERQQTSPNLQSDSLHRPYQISTTIFPLVAPAAIA
jgi:hypothetical protein